MSVSAIKSRTEIPGTRSATIVEVLATGEIIVRFDGRRGQIVCDFLEVGGQHLELGSGDRVLVLVPDGSDTRPAVVGRIGPYKKPDRRQVILQADEELIVRCGEASITFRKSGKILIKGVDIVSHARQRNRIRGGSIQIN